jgi:pyruvate,water dikinase
VPDFPPVWPGAVTQQEELHPIEEGDAPRAGVKATRLGRLARAGFPVPRGVVLTVDEVASGDLDALARAAATALGGVAVAVRSSGVAEDLESASFAGLYETVLDVRGPAAIVEALRRCRNSATGERVTEYTPGRSGAGARRELAILVQEMVAAEVSGVAFTANPLTGDRRETTITAVRGLGERLVGGEAIGDAWMVRDGRIERRADATGQAVLDRTQAAEVAALARRVEAHLGGAPQDIEWAFAGGRLHLLQARPMTALPEDVDWTPPRDGGWMRHFRLGEHPPDPVTPLFTTWAIERMERRFLVEQETHCGFRVAAPMHVVVNGWYFCSPFGSSGPSALLGMLWRKPSFFYGTLRMSTRPDILERGFVGGQVARWREDLLPRYQSLVADGQRQVATADTAALIDLVDAVCDVAGDYLFSIAMVAGFAWKTEGPLAAFYRAHLNESVGGSHQTLLCGLAPPAPLTAHAIESIDWYWPTLGERDGHVAATMPTLRHAELKAARARLEVACRAALAGSRSRLERFEILLGLAQRYAVLREEQVRDLSLGWPLLRRVLLRLGEDCRRRGVIVEAGDVYFLSREELGAASSCAEAVRTRRAAWQRHRRLVPPLVIGELPSFMKTNLVAAVENMRAPGSMPATALRGMPASPGRATGPARIVHGNDDFKHVRDGDVLVAAVATPAYTTLFTRVAAVVTDGGSVAAHASLVAREYGIPAVVGTIEATRLLRDGDLVTVDGSLGFVESRCDGPA